MIFSKSNNMTLCIGHRGAAGHEPENTLRSFRKAIDLGASAIELDVWVVEGQLLVFHDDTLERTTNGKGLLVEQSLEYLRNLDAGCGEKIPFLWEVLSELGHSVCFNIELKGPNVFKETREMLLEFLRKPGWSIENFIVSSFDHTQLGQFHSLTPNFRRGLLIDGIPEDLDRKLRDLKPFSIHQSLEHITKDLVIRAHSQGLKVYVYTVNTAEDIDRVLEYKVDGIFSDFPDRVLDLVSCKNVVG